MPDDTNHPDRDLRDLIDAYLDGAPDAAQLAALEARLRADPAARRFLVRYARHDRDLRLEVHARRQTEAALAKLGAADDAPATLRLPTPRFRPLRWAAAAAVVALAAGTGWFAATQRADRRNANANPPVVVPTAPVTQPQVQPDVAWLVNAQNCRWSAGTAPSDMRAGTVLAVDRGLAEVRFRSGAVVLIEGPARLELLGENSARLHRGRVTGTVAGPVKGFALYAPGGKVVDLGTEFGVAVADSGQTDVYVFNGKVEAVGADAKVVSLTGDQAARIDGGQVTVRDAGGSAADAPAFVRRIVPPAVIEPRSLALNFAKAYEGTLADAQGLGTGLTHRLPGTGGALPPADPNLVVNSDEGRLELTTTNSDINGQRGLPTGEYLGVRLADLGFTGPEDFEVQMVVPNIPALQSVGQFGLYAGGRSDKVIRGGLISRGEQGYTLFMTNNDGGRDADSHFVGLFAMGDDVRVCLKRTNGKYALTVENLTTGSASTLNIRHPGFLDPENDLYVGLFGANTRSEVRRTLLVKEFAVTVWTKAGEPRSQTVAALP